MVPLFGFIQGYFVQRNILGIALPELPKYPRVMKTAKPSFVYNPYALWNIWPWRINRDGCVWIKANWWISILPRCTLAYVNIIPVHWEPINNFPDYTQILYHYHFNRPIRKHDMLSPYICIKEHEMHDTYATLTARLKGYQSFQAYFYYKPMDDNDAIW